MTEFNPVLTEYVASKFWQQLNKDCDRHLAEKGYENFKRTVGLIYNNWYFDGKKLDQYYHHQLKRFWDILHEIVPSDLLDKFEEPREGNPLTIEYKKKPVSFDLGMSLYEYYLISKYVDFSKVSVIHEIGAGYGRTAYVILKLYPEIIYRIFDVEPSLSLAKRYLTSVLPGARLELNTPDKIGGLCDVFLAIDCLHEMTREHVQEYFEYADKSAEYFYFSVFEKTHTPLDEIDWNIKDYPVMERWTKEFSRKHGVRSEHWEALYKI